MKYRKKPVIIEAEQFTRENFSKVKSFCPLHSLAVDGNKVEALLIKTIEGEMRADWGDWIIKEANGEFYPCKPDIFEKTYEAVVMNDEED